MPQFYFNVRDSGDINDVEGMELPDFKAARLEGIRLSGAILKNEAGQIDADQDWKLEVTDHTGLILFIMAFSITQSAAVPLPRRNGFGS